MNNSVPITAASVKSLHDARLANPQSSAPNDSDIWRWVGENHRNNYLLWDQEDLARRNDAPASEIMANKRAIDGYNQARNDAIEKTDEYLLIALGLISAQEAASTAPQATITLGARLNSETAGSMVDRMSIVALKIRAMTAQTQCQAKLARLHEQRDDLGDCLDRLLTDSLSGKAYFKVYRQFKMYNDPHLNPVLVAERKGA
jgi:hypothetical protein